jgi:Tol biopolymer transport system component
MGRCIATLALLFALLAPAAAEATPRNGRILFSEPGKLRSIRPDGTQLRLVSDTWFREYAPAPGGRTIVSPGSERLELFSASDASPAGEVKVPGKAWIGRASFAPTGSPLAFYSCEETVFTDIDECVAWGIYRVRPDGSDLRRISSGALPAWSLDGHSLTFMHRLHAKDADGDPCYGVYTSGPDGQRLHRLVPRRHRCALPKFYDVRPAFAASGRIVYNRRGAGLWSVRADGSGARRIVKAPRGKPVTRFAVSPDGRRLVYAASGGVYVTGAGGGRGRRIATQKHLTGLAWLALPSGASTRP